MRTWLGAARKWLKSQERARWSWWWVFRAAATQLISTQMGIRGCDEHHKFCVISPLSQPQMGWTTSSSLLKGAQRCGWEKRWKVPMPIHGLSSQKCGSHQRIQPDVLSLFLSDFWVTDTQRCVHQTHLVINHRWADYCYWYKKQPLGINSTSIRWWNQW